MQEFRLPHLRDTSIHPIPTLNWHLPQLALRVAGTLQEAWVAFFRCLAPITFRFTRFGYVPLTPCRSRMMSYRIANLRRDIGGSLEQLGGWKGGAFSPTFLPFPASPLPSLVFELWRC